MANTRQRPPQSSFAALFRPQMRRPSPSWARPQDNPPHSPQESSHSHSHPVPASPDQLGTGLFREEAATRRPPVNAGNSARDGNPVRQWWLAQINPRPQIRSAEPVILPFDAFRPDYNDFDAAFASIAYDIAGATLSLSIITVPDSNQPV